MNKHKKRKSTDDHRGKIPNTGNISERPNGCMNRSRFGHFESDTVLGMRKTGLLGTHVERKSGFLVAFKLDTKTEKEFSEATIEAFKSIPKKLKKSFTVDNGKEFAMHEYIKEQTGMEVFAIRILHGKEEPMKIQTVFFGNSFQKEHRSKMLQTKNFKRLWT